MSGNWVERLAGVKRRKVAKEEAGLIKQKREGYKGRAEALQDVLNSLGKERARSAELAHAGFAVAEPDFTSVVAALKSELEKEEFHEFDLQSVMRPWNAISLKWTEHLNEGYRSVVAALPGANLEPSVLTTLRPHFSEVVDGIKDRAKERKKLLGDRGAGSLAALKVLHDADLEALKQLAGADASEDWKLALVKLVSGEGITWTDLEQGPLRDWLEEHELLRRCFVRLQ